MTQSDIKVEDKKKTYEEHYSNAYFDGWVENSFKSAKALLGILYKIYQPESVADFGCGRGVWLTTCEILGSKVLHGYDGPWVDESKLYSKNIEFFQSNFEAKVELRRKYDLAMSVEVAEHVSESNAENFVEMITDASDVVVFGAAAKGQGGENHINEQWQSYWIEKFKKNGYACFDIFRPALWHDKNVDWWYRQNTFLFVKEAALSKKFDIGFLRSLESGIYDIVHPDSFEYRLNLFNVAKENACAKLKEENTVLETEVESLETEVERMMSSKFWKVRDKYMKLKEFIFSKK